MAAMASILADARAFVDARSPWELTVLAASTFLVLGITAALLKLAARRPPTKDGPKWCVLPAGLRRRVCELSCSCAVSENQSLQIQPCTEMLSPGAMMHLLFHTI